MKKSKKAISVLLSLLMVLSIFTSIPFQTMAATTQDTKVGASSAKESIVYKSNDEYIEVADFGNSDYVDLDSSKEIYYKIYVDYELFYGSTLQLKVKSLDSGSISTSSISIGKPSSYDLTQYVPIDLSDYSGKIELSIWLVLANGQKYYDGEPVKLNIYSKIASGTCGDNLTWQLFDNGTLEISGTGEMTDYDNCGPWGKEIKSVVIEDGVADIGKSAFRKCSGLTSVILPNSITNIGCAAFQYCSGLTDINIPNSVSNINSCAFSYCTGLTSISLPNNISNIADETFYGCSELKKVIIPSAVTSIGSCAFRECKALTSIDIPDNVVSIASGAFSHCTGLTTLTIGANIKYISDYAFTGCSGLTSISVSSGNSLYDSRQNCNALIDTKTNNLILGCKNTLIPNGIISIGSNAFYGCSGLTSVSIPNSVTSIGDSAFAACTELENINIPDNVKHMGSYAFASTAWYENQPNGLVYVGKILYGYKGNMAPDSSITIQYGTKVIADSAFERCSELTSITIPNSVTNIGYCAFLKCSGLTDINVSDSVAVVESSAFGDTAWYNLQPEGLVYIGKVAYKYKGIMPSGTEIKIKNGTKGISGYAFYSCGMTSIEIPNSVTNIGNGAFSYCTGLQSITIPDSVTTIGLEAFSASGINNLIIGSGVVSIGFGAFQNTTHLTSVTIPSNVKSIGEKAFGYYYGKNGVYQKVQNFTIYGIKGTAAENYANENGFTFVSTQTTKQISLCNITINPTSCYFDGTAKTPSVTVKDGSTTLTNGTDYTVTYSNNTNVGTATVIITGKGNYSGTASKIFTISAKSISSATVTLGTTSYTYDGTAKKPSVTVKDGTTTLTNGTDYTVTYSNNINVGTATVTITGKGNYTGTVSKTFTINAKSISSTTVTLGTTSYTYDGTAKKPSVTVKDGSKTLTSGTDYTVSYSNNTNVGTATVTITGKGNYTGIASKTFTIKAKSISSATVTLGTTSYTYDGTAKKPSVTVKDGTKTLTSGTDYTVSYSNNTNVGTATVTITGKGNYTGTVSKNFTIINLKQEFTWGQDNWNFNNWSPDYFPDTTYRQQMSSEYLNELSENLTNDEYQYVFKGVYTRFGYQKAMLDDVWGGSCYGMSATTFLSEKEILPYSQYKSGASKLNDLNIPKDDINVMSLINYYQMLQVKDSVQQQYYSAKKKSNKENIQNIISQLDTTGLVLVGFRQDNWGGHAILAYGYEYGSWTKNNVTYNGRILICDPNRSSNKYANYEDCYIYFNTNTYNWVIPLYYNTGYKVSSANGAYINMVCSDIDIINDGGYLPGNSYNKTDNYVARLDAYQISDDRSISKVKENENGQYINYSSSADDIEEAYSFINRGEAEGIIGYNLYDANSSYKVTQDKPQEIQLAIRYDNCLLQGGSAAGNSVIFDKNGFIQINSESACFDMSMTFNEDYDTDWFTIQVNGSNTDIASLKKVDGGYIIQANNLENVNIGANNKEDSAFTNFSTDYDSVYIYEINPNTIGLKVDTDNNGTYETELKTKMIGDANGDGEVDIQDVTCIQMYVAKLGTGTVDASVCDLDGDGKVGISDVSYLQMKLAKLI